jgi:SAM-dependent methyltransferase
MGPGRLWRSLRRRGVLGSADRLLSVLQERLFDLRYGTDTVSFAELDLLTIQSRSAAEGTPYQPTRLRLVRQVLSALKPSPESAFVDFGCGKGRVLLLAAEYRFRRVTGVEFAKELCEIARDNIARYRVKTGSQADIRIVEGDALEYEVGDDENYFFMFNPFSAELVEKVAGNIARSLKSQGRRGLLIYNNPMWSEAVQHQGFVPSIAFNGGECVVYRNDLDAKTARVGHRAAA